MVKQMKTAAALIAAATLLLVSCKNLASGTVSGSSLNGRADITVVLTENDNARYLAPAALTTGSTEISYYSLVGESLEGTAYKYEAAAAVSADSNASPKVPAIALKDNKILPSALLATGADTFTLKDMVIDDWTFTLTAYDVAGNALLKGTSVCALKSAAESTVSFTLSSVDVESKGGYSITIKYDNSDGSWKTDNYNFKYGLYNTFTGEMVSGTTLGTVAYTAADDIVSANGYTAATASNNIAPGSYVFGITMYDKAAKKLAYVSDIILIEPGRVTEGTINIKEAIATAPKAPENLIAQRITEMEDGDSYVVRFQWEDKSNNETQFKLVLKEFTGTAATDTWKQYVAGTVGSTDADSKESLDTTLEKSTPSIPAGTTVYTWDSIQTLNTGAIRYVGGSLYAGSTEIVLKLPTGHLYDVQVYAVNGIGWSDACVRKATSSTTALGAGTTGTETATAITAIQGKIPAGYAITNSTLNVPVRINLVRLSYDLGGGTMKLTGQGSNITVPTYVEYKVYELNTGAGVGSTYALDDAENEKAYLPLLTITKDEPSTGTPPYLVNASGVAFNGWIYALEGTGAKSEIAHNVNKFGNITVSALYGVTVSDITLGTVSVETLPELDDNDVSLLYGTDKTGANSNAIPDDGISKVRGTTTPYYVTVQIKPSGDFVRYMLYVKGNYVQEYFVPATVPTTYNFTNIAVSDLVVGVQNEFVVTAVTSDGKMASVRKTVYVSNN